MITNMLLIVANLSLLTGMICADEAVWSRSEFTNGVSVEAPLKLTQPDKKTESFIALNISPLPDPRFDMFSLAVFPISPEATPQEINKMLKEKSDYQTGECKLWWTAHGVKRDQSKEEHKLQTTASTRFRPLPYDLYHVIQAKVIGDKVYVMGVASIIQCSNRVAIKEFGLIPSKEEIEREQVSIQAKAERYFDSLQIPSDLAGSKEQKKP